MFFDLVLIILLCNSEVIYDWYFEWIVEVRKLRPELGFEPTTSGLLVRRSPTWATLVTPYGTPRLLTRLTGFFSNVIWFYGKINPCGVQGLTLHFTLALQSSSDLNIGRGFESHLRSKFSDFGYSVETPVVNHFWITILIKIKILRSSWARTFPSKVFFRRKHNWNWATTKF